MAKVISLKYEILSEDYIALSQTRVGAGNLIINGAGLDPISVSITRTTVKFNKFQRQVTITSDADDSGISFIVTGEDFKGDIISETIVGPATATVTTTAYFSMVTNISTTGSTTGNITIGVATTGKSWLVPADYRNETIKYLLTFDVTATCSYTLQYTGDDVYNTAYGSIKWWDWPSANVVAATTDQVTTSVTPVTAFQIVINSSSGSGALDVRIVESGITA